MMLISELLQFLGLVSNYSPCPNPYDLAPCECFPRYDEVKCLYHNFNEYERGIQRTEFTQTNFGNLEFDSTDGIDRMDQNILGPLAFQSIYSGFPAPDYLDFAKVFEASLNSLERLKYHPYSYPFREDKQMDPTQLVNLDKFQHLKELSLERELNITEMPLLNAPKLHSLSITGARIKKWSLEALQNSTNLEYLNLQSNLLDETTVTKGKILKFQLKKFLFYCFLDHFKPFEKLKTLILSNNQFKKLTRDTFGGIPTLESIGLMSNSELSVIEPGLFWSVSSFKS